MRHVFRNRMRSTVIVTKKNGVSYRGVLFDQDTQAIVLRNVELLMGADPTIVDGELILLWADVDTTQIV